MTNPTVQRHIDAVSACNVTKSNVIGMRKIINHGERIRAGWSGNRSSATPDDMDRLKELVEHKQPLVTGELHETGLAVLRNKRYAKRLEHYMDVIANIKAFHLVRFDRIGDRGQYAVPVYRANAGAGAYFYFRNIPWQSHGDGPEIVKGN